MLKPLVPGRNLADCKNAISCSLGAIRNLLAAIPISDPDKFDKHAAKVGGKEYVIQIAGTVIGLAGPQPGIVTDAMRSLFKEWCGDEMPDSIQEIGLQAMITNPVLRNKYNQPTTVSDLYDIANVFGFFSNGYLNVYDFVYLRSKQKFVDIYNVSSLYTPKSIQSDALPVLIDSEHRLWMDADEYGMQNLCVDDIVFDPTFKTGIVHNVICNCGDIVTATGRALFNTYAPPTCAIGSYAEEQPEAFVQPFLNHVRKLLPHEGDAKLLIQWCAHIIQRPGEKIRWAPILYSIDQGVGKDTIINFVQEIVGKRYCSTIKPTDIGGNFNEWAQSILIRISEVSDVSEKSSRRKFQEEVKTIISGDDKFVTINEKYGLKHNARNIAHVIITTNNPQDIAVSEEDRRYDVMECATKQAMGIEDLDARKNYFDALYKWYENGGKEKLYAFLLHVDLSDFKATVPRLTEAKKVLQQNTMEYLNWIQDVIDVIGDNQNELGIKIFRADTFIALAKEMCDNLPQWSGPEKNKIPTMFRNNISRFKFQTLKGTKSDGRVTISKGKKTTIYCKGYKESNFAVDKKDLLRPEQVPDIVSLLTPVKHNYNSNFNGTYKIY